MKTKDITLTCNIPDNVTPDELEEFLSFKFLGGDADDKLLSKFKYEELDVDHVSIN